MSHCAVPRVFVEPVLPVAAVTGAPPSPLPFDPWSTFVDGCFAHYNSACAPLVDLYSEMCVRTGDVVAEMIAPVPVDVVPSERACAPTFASLTLEEQFARLKKQYGVAPSGTLRALIASLPPLEDVVPEEVCPYAFWAALVLPSVIDDAALPRNVYWQASRALLLKSGAYAYRNMKEGYVVPEERTLSGLNQLAIRQDSPVIVLPVALGLRFRGTAPRVARAQFVSNEFGLPTYAILTIARTHRDVLARDALGYFALGEQYAPRGDYQCTETPILYKTVETRLNGTEAEEIRLSSRVSNAGTALYGGVTGFLW